MQDERITAAAREWLSDCFPDDGEIIADLTPAEIVYGVERYYDGGMTAFEADFAVVGYLGRGL